MVTPLVDDRLTERPVRIVLASERNVKTTQRGTLIRETSLAPSLALAKDALTLAMRAGKTPHGQRPAALALLCEAVSNWWRHNPGGDCFYIFAAHSSCVELVFRYPSVPFDTHPPEPEELAESGMGIITMRGLCSYDPETDEIPYESPNIRFEFSRGRVVIRLALRW